MNANTPIGPLAEMAKKPKGKPNRERMARIIAQMRRGKKG